jgi:REP element-mobilizing transposase RayT
MSAWRVRADRNVSDSTRKSTAESVHVLDGSHRAIAVFFLTSVENIATIKCMVHRAQLEFDLRSKPCWGGAREGAGRKASARARVWHRERTEFPERFPGLVTLRVRRDVPSLRSVRFVREVERSLREISDRNSFRVIHYSIQNDHVHLLTEAEDAAALGCGMKSVAARFARAANRVFGRRGAVLDGRYHHRALATPREVRSALAYVLLNARKHGVQRVARSGVSQFQLDPASSSRWFDGWDVPPPLACDAPVVAHPRTWLLRAGWRRHGPIRHDEVPGGGRKHASQRA